MSSAVDTDASSSAVHPTGDYAPGNDQRSMRKLDYHILDTRHVRMLVDDVQPAALREMLFEYVVGAEEKRLDIREWRLSVQEHTFQEDLEMQTPTAFRSVSSVDYHMGIAMMKLENEMIAAGMLLGASSPGSVCAC